MDGDGSSRPGALVLREVRAFESRWERLLPGSTYQENRPPPGAAFREQRKNLSDTLPLHEDSCQQHETRDGKHRDARSFRDCNRRMVVVVSKHRKTEAKHR